MVLAAAIMLSTVSVAQARHQWADYHWALPSGETQLTINVNNCQQGSGLYGYNTADHFTGPNSDWTGVISDSGGAIVVSDGSCPALTAPDDPIATFADRITAYDGSTGTVNTFNGDYGNNGWVGVAIVELDSTSGDNHIVYGETHLNDYYAGQFAVYNDPLVMRKVQCQEIGHTFGLDHIKKDTSCMYSSMAFIGSTYTPNGHDGEVVNAITDDHSAGGTPPPEEGGGGPCAKNPDHWKCQAGAGPLRGKATWAESYGSREEMFEAADVVVNARVLQGSLFDRVVGPPGAGLPLSQAVLQIRETFKGNARGVIRVEHTRGLGLEIVDDPGYVNGDDYLLFLRRTGANTFRVVNPDGRIQQ